MNDLSPPLAAAALPDYLTGLNTAQRDAALHGSGPHADAGPLLDAQAAWDNGRMNVWPKYKNNHSMGYFAQDDMPFQFAMAKAFTICDAYFCSAQAGTNTNRLFQWTGTNDPLGKGNGPATYNDYDWFDADHGDGGYTWTTYPERLEAAGLEVTRSLVGNYITSLEMQGCSVTVLLLSGVARVVWGIKGWPWYVGQPLFHIKMTLVLITLVIVARPSFTIRRWVRTLDANGTLPSSHEINRLRSAIMLHTHIMPFIAVLAVFWARGW